VTPYQLNSNICPDKNKKLFLNFISEIDSSIVKVRKEYFDSQKIIYINESTKKEESKGYLSMFWGGNPTKHDITSNITLSSANVPTGL
jgi:flagellar hook assembly protein FlgD